MKDKKAMVKVSTSHQISKWKMNRDAYGGFVICAKPHTNGNDRETLEVK